MRRLLAALLLVSLALVWFELAWPPFYEFAPAQPFRGERWYNPYAGYRGGGLLAAECRKQALQQGNQAEIHQGQGSRQGAVDQGAADDDVDFPQPVAQDGDARSDRHGRDRDREEVAIQ